jgi:hypothetical protein
MPMLYEFPHTHARALRAIANSSKPQRRRSGVVHTDRVSPSVMSSTCEAYGERIVRLYVSKPCMFSGDYQSYSAVHFRPRGLELEPGIWRCDELGTQVVGC